MNNDVSTIDDIIQITSVGIYRYHVLDKIDSLSSSGRKILDSVVASRREVRQMEARLMDLNEIAFRVDTDPRAASMLGAHDAVPVSEAESARALEMRREILRSATKKRQELIEDCKSWGGFPDQCIDLIGEVFPTAGWPSTYRNAARETRRLTCLSLGIDSENRHCSDYSDALSALRQKPFFYNRPREVRFQKPFEISLAVGDERTIDSIMTELPGELVSGTLRASQRMQATLFGPAFSVAANTQAEQIIMSDQPTRWSWQVEALEPGETQTLTIAVFVVLYDEDKALPPIMIRTYRDKIDVHVGLGQRIGITLGNLGPIESFILALASLATASSPLLIWLGRKDRKGSEQEKTGTSLIGFD